MTEARSKVWEIIGFYIPKRNSFYKERGESRHDIQTSVFESVVLDKAAGHMLEGIEKGYFLEEEELETAWGMIEDTVESTVRTHVSETMEGHHD